MMRMRTAGRSLIGRVGQIGLLGLAAAIATQLYSGWQLDRFASADKTSSPALTSGGKFAAKVAGVVSEPAGSPFVMPRPTLSIVNWAITPTRSKLLIDDVSWDVLRDSWGGQPSSAKTIKAAHEGRRILAAAAGSDGPSNAAPIPRLDFQTVPATVEAPSDGGGLWSGARAAAASLGSAGMTLLARANPF